MLTLWCKNKQKNKLVSTFTISLPSLMMKISQALLMKPSIIFGNTCIAQLFGWVSITTRMKKTVGSSKLMQNLKLYLKARGSNGRLLPMRPRQVLASKSWNVIILSLKIRLILWNAPYIGKALEERIFTRSLSLSGSKHTYLLVKVSALTHLRLGSQKFKASVVYWIIFLHIRESLEEVYQFQISIRNNLSEILKWKLKSYAV